jgi:hypothetical protein
LPRKVERLTKPTTGRVVLWSTLAFLWLLFLVQAVASLSASEVSIPGAIFWGAVQAWLLWMAWVTWRRRGRSAKLSPQS